MIEGELLINSDEHPGTTLHENSLSCKAIGSKYEILALTDVSYILFLVQRTAVAMRKPLP